MACQSRSIPVLAALLCGLAGATRASAAPGPLHVASPDWQDQVIYFVMTDRFDDGDASNNDQGAGEFDAGDGARYNGGDFAGIERRLDYIRGLGATVVWVTPPVANLWWDAVARHGGYHGYWAEHFMRVDAHLGTLGDYQRLSRKLHGSGMYLVQDIVINHTGSWFDYGSGWRADDPSSGFQRPADSRGRHAPSQWPFLMNDAREPRQRAAAIYHWTPKIADYKDPRQVLDFQMSSLDDLNSENPVVRKALRESYGFWIREAGVDAFRIDTAFYVPTDALADFLYSDDADAPGVLAVARATGREGFHVFGEGFSTDHPYQDEQARRIDALMRGADGKPLLPGMLNFPLYATIGDVFARGRPTAEMGHRIRSMMQVHARPHLMPTFVDNHDVDRFLSGGREPGLRQALLMLMTLPGIPTIYYGTEQGFTGQRAAMFKGGSGAGGRDHFDADAPLYRFLQRAIALRREHRVFSRGRPTILRENAGAPGVLAYRMDWGDHAAIVAFNTAGQPALLDALETGAAPGTRLVAAFDIDGPPRDLVAGADGRVDLVLPPHAGQAWLLSGRAQAPPRSSAAISIHAGVPATVREDFELRGRASGLSSFQLVVDDDLASATTVTVGRRGEWRSRVDTSRMIDPAISHRLVAWSAQTATASPAIHFKVERQWQTLAELPDPVGDDHGPGKRYSYPSDDSWGAHRQLDIQHLTVQGSGGALRLVFRMHEISTPWNPPNGFDHVAFNVFVQLPGRADGVAAMPAQNATLPDGMRWHYRLRAHGWSNALFESSGAGASAEGRPASPAPTIEVDAARRTVAFTFSSAAFGGLRSLAGVRVYANTWDYDGGYRPLKPQPAGSMFGGGDGAVDPLLMDETDVIVLP